MPRDRSSVELELTVLAADLTKKLVRALERLTSSGRRSFKALTFNGDGDAEFFVEQFEDVAVANDWPDREAFLHMHSSLQGTACTYG